MNARGPATAVGLLAAGPCVVTSLYLVGLLAAGWPAVRRPRGRADGAPVLPVVVLVPAHDEASVIEAAVASMRASVYPEALLRIIVVADNCRDETAALARAAGAGVWERTDTAARGKGHALAWALDRLAPDLHDRAVVLFVDADCTVSPNLVAECEAAIRAGEQVVQCDYVVANPDAAPAAALRFAAFRLVNTVRPAGKDALGLSAGLLGTGMAFRGDVLRELGWHAASITEDLEQHLRIVESGRRVAFLASAAVSSPMPETHAEADSQQLRWEGGRARLAGGPALGLLAQGVRRGDRVLAHAAFELLLPPQSALGAGNLVLAAAATVAGRRSLRRMAFVGLAGQAGFVVGGLVATRAPAPVWRALLGAPALIARKLGVLGRVAGGGTPDEFVRTQRS
ncbi:glycosyltransferase [Svornostia abyssi]|uniref:Glycosyltransferase n=1 Tax=Svornostia abyssi TaxID=2898438 RepID=A0ABY5PG21_9ACTN|nr:glycosyltransferase [Parviterribacteraceae bacterium J379]